MAVIAVTNIYGGLKSYVPGEVIEDLTAKEERRLIELKCAKAVPVGEPATKTVRKKS